VLERALAVLDGALELAFERVGLGADALARVRIETGEGLQDFSESTSFASQELGLELLEPSGVGAGDLLETLPQRV
jgi:hypothetical protein